MAVANTLGFGLAGLVMFPMWEDLFAAHDTVGRTTNVRIGVGMDDSGMTDIAGLGGDRPGIAIFDIAGNLISYNSGGNTIQNEAEKISANSFLDVKLLASKEVGGMQAEYLSMSAGGNGAICVAYLGITWADGTRHSWTGDIAKLCNVPWFPSKTKTTADNYMSACVWIDGDHSDGKQDNGFIYQGMGIHVPDFTGTEQRARQYNNHPETVCKSKPRFHMYEKLTIYDCIPYFSPSLSYQKDNLTDPNFSVLATDGKMKHCEPPQELSQPVDLTSQWSNKLRKSRQESKTQFMAGILVASSYEGHSAIEVCSSNSSRGPDFISTVEGYFCDMSDKTLYPLCTDSTTEACFDMETQSLRPAAGIHPRFQLLPRKEYHNVHNWGVPESDNQAEASDSAK